VSLVFCLKEVRKMAKKETVTRIIDGDTFQTASRKHSVRLANVNAPEKGKRGSAKAKQALASLIQGQRVEIDTVARDPYRRAVANVKVGGKSVNAAMNRKLKK
jgi:endonuclease YncB( thermonuclease family)